MNGRHTETYLLFLHTIHKKIQEKFPQAIRNHKKHLLKKWCGRNYEQIRNLTWKWSEITDTALHNTTTCCLISTDPAFLFGMEKHGFSPLIRGVPGWSRFSPPGAPRPAPSTEIRRGTCFPLPPPTLTCHLCPHHPFPTHQPHFLTPWRAGGRR